jgi:hypothetical protein
VNDDRKNLAAEPMTTGEVKLNHPNSTAVDAGGALADREAQPFTACDLKLGEKIVMELHGLTGFNAWAEHLAKVVAALRSALPAAGLEEWIDKNFTGYGVAVRRQTDDPIPGEPFMSMAVAKDLTRQAVASFRALPAAGETDLYKRLDAAREQVFASLRRLGYEPTVEQWANSTEEMKKKSAQYRLRDKTEAPKSFEEVTAAVLEALIVQGGFVVHDGDGVSCVAQMIWAQHERAETVAIPAAGEVREAMIAELEQALEDSNSLFAAMLHEKRAGFEIETQIYENRDLLNKRTNPRSPSVTGAGALRALASIMSCLRTSSDILVDGYVIHVTKKQYENAQAALALPQSKEARTIPGAALNHALLDLVRLCVRDGIGNLDLKMENVVVDGKDAGTWSLRLERNVR